MITSAPAAERKHKKKLELHVRGFKLEETGREIELWVTEWKYKSLRGILGV